MSSNSKKNNEILNKNVVLNVPLNIPGVTSSESYYRMNKIDIENNKLKKKMKDKKYHNAKMAAYRKSKQPVTDGTGENSGSGVNIKLESSEKRKENVLYEEFSKMKNLISYDRKTQ